MASGYYLQTAVLLIAVIKRHPGCDASSRLNTQIKLVLVQGLSSRPSWLEVKHRLDSERLLAEKLLKYRAQTLVNHPVKADLVPAVHMD